jgi:hypothetical protein
MSTPLKFELNRRQGVLNIGYGAGSSPSFTNLTVTGIITAPNLTSPALSPLTLGTGTSGAAITVLSANNNVGIGTATPNNPLHLKAPAGSLSMRFEDGTAGLIGFIGGANGLVSSPISGTMMIRSENGLYLSGTGNSADVFIKNGGNVGIGTTTPNSQLDVFKTSTGGKLRLSSNVNSTYGELIFSSNDASYLGYGSSIEGTGDSNGLNVGDLIFKTGYGEVRTERMKINRSGVVTLANSTAGSAGAGALVVTGGLATGAASYFGGAVTGTSLALTAPSATALTLTSPSASQAALNFTDSSPSGLTWLMGPGVSTGSPTSFALRCSALGANVFAISSTGAATFAGAVTATNVNSATGTVSAPNATATTLFAASTRGMYQVYAYIDAYDPNDWAATAVVTNTGNGSTLKITATNAASFTLTVSGLNVRVTQSGGSTFDVAWRYVRIQ